MKNIGVSFVFSGVVSRDEVNDIGRAVIKTVIRDERASNTLLRYGIRSLTEIVAMSEADLLKLDTMGVVGVQRIRESLEAVGLYLRGERPARLPERV